MKNSLQQIFSNHNNFVALNFSIKVTVLIETPARAFRFRITKKAPHTTLRVWSCGRLNLLPILLQKKNKWVAFVYLSLVY